MMGYNIANASMDMAMSGFSGIGAISSVQDAISITRTIRAAMVSLSVSFATWEKSVEDQQQLLAGKAFKADSDPAGESGIRAGDEITTSQIRPLLY